MSEESLALVRARALMPGRLARVEESTRWVLPERATDGVLLDARASNVSVRFQLVGAAPRPRRVVEGLGVYPGALARGDWLLRPIRDGIEDFVVLTQPTPGSRVVYRVDVTRVAGVRFVGGVLELLDSGGVPRLRAVAPFAMDAGGTRVELAASLSGCRFDSDGRPPFGRSVTAPGTDSCELSLAYPKSGVRFPLAIDPAWTATGSMAFARAQHQIAVLPSNKLLTAMGVPGKEAEIYDPASGTWAMAKPTLAAHPNGSLVALANGKIFAFAGPIAQTELYDESTGNWTQTTGSLTYPRYTFGRSTRLADGRVLVAGGLYGPGPTNAELFDPTTNGWSPAGTIAEGRNRHVMVQLNDGRVLIAGGYSGEFFSDPIRSSAEVWSPATKSWTTVGSLGAPRADAQGVVLPGGKVLVIGGVRNDALPNELSTTELFDPTTNTFSPGPNLNRSRFAYELQKLPDGRFLVAGGCPLTDPSAEDSELLNAAGTSFVNAGKLVNGDRCNSASGPLPGGKVLLSGGGNVESSSEVWGLVGNGGTCVLNAECSSGACVDGMCCSSTCTGTCESCLGAKNGGQNGVCAKIPANTDPDAECGSCNACNGSGQCGPVPAGTDPKQNCKDSGSPACQNDGACDGAGACEQYASSAGCTPSPCTSGAECASGFCRDGVCCDANCSGSCQACTAAKKGSGVDGVCGPVAADTDPDNECAQGPGFPTSCLADGDCDGTGKCREFAKDTVSCGATQCVGGSAQGLLCNGAGQCLSATTSCEPYVCSANQCQQACSVATDCAVNAYCSTQGSCLPKQPQGEACSAGKECQSGFCVDGFCCDGSCGGQCEACNVAPNEGTCTPVVGAPVGARPECVGDGSECSGQCDGVNPTACNVPPSGESCSTPACSGTQSSFSSCNGKGACIEQTEDCAPYACDGTACGTSCTGDDDCAPDYVCNPETAHCVAAAGKCQSDGITLETSTGETKSCSPYRCQAGECTDPCVTSSQCVNGFACDEGKCVHLGAEDSEEDAGCGCRSTRGSASSPFYLLGALLFVLRRRRRRT